MSIQHIRNYVLGGEAIIVMWNFAIKDASFNGVKEPNSIKNPLILDGGEFHALFGYGLARQKKKREKKRKEIKRLGGES